MQALLNPRILFLVQTLPALILCWLCNSDYQVIKTMLSPEAKLAWMKFSWSLLALSVITAGYAAYAWWKNKTISLWYCIPALLVWSVYLYQYLQVSELIWPWQIPNWMISDNAFFYPLTFLMPAAAHALFVCAASRIDQGEEMMYSVMGAIMVPIVMYIVVQSTSSSRSFYFMGILFLIATVAFLFFLVRIFVHLMHRKAQLDKRFSVGWKVIISIILPVVGLIVNNYMFGGFNDPWTTDHSGVFGAFSTPWFYALAIANGLVVSFLPANLGAKGRLLWFVLRCIGFAYTVYFLLVFLPWLPFSLLAIIALGTGVLMLVPIVLFVVQLTELHTDFVVLRTWFRSHVLWLSGIAAFLFIPSVITIGYYQDKRTLQQALEYLWAPEYNKPADKVNVASLRKTIQMVERQREGQQRGIATTGSNGDLPYLSTWFQSIVLDNQTLSNSRLALLKRVYFGAQPTSFANQQARLLPLNGQATLGTDISSVTVNPTFDTAQQAWLTWIDLEITNPSDQQTEYATQFTLDPGCFLTDYYLYVGGKKEMGQLAEKKSALWVFSQIKQIRRDPGILYYSKGNEIVFQVYPFAQKEVRKTGFQILHKAPFTLQLGDHTIAVNTPTTTTTSAEIHGEIAYLSAEAKAALPLKQRKPYLHFIVDATTDSLVRYVSRMEAVMTQHPKWVPEARISTVGAYIQTQSLNPSSLSTILTDPTIQRQEDGFYFDRAIRQSLTESFAQQADLYPIFVVVSDQISEAVIERNFEDLAFAYPDVSVFAHVLSDGTIQQHDLRLNPIAPLHDSFTFAYEKSVRVFQWPDGTVTHISAEAGPAYALRKDATPAPILQTKEKHWPTALQLQAHHLSQILHPESGDAAWLELVRSSFASRIMMPVTSYLVVETEAQRAALKRKQAEMLNSHKYFDAQEDDVEELSEPHIYITALLLLVFIWWRQRRGLA
jgi:hypothetical protein